MKVNCALELSDQDRRRVRAAIGRGGVATRKEIRIFAERAIRGALAAAPEPKPKRGSREGVMSRPFAYAPGHAPGARQTLAELQALPDDARCALCGRPKDEHGRMGLTCPPRSGQPHGRRFTPQAVR